MKGGTEEGRWRGRGKEAEAERPERGEREKEKKNRKEKEGRIDRRLNGGNDCQREINKKGVNWKAVHP